MENWTQNNIKMSLTLPQVFSEMINNQHSKELAADIIILTELSQTKTNLIRYPLYMESKKK